MEKIVHGVHHFQDVEFPTQRQLFQRLAKLGQKPRALFITCSDSRILPNWITTTDPGELFLIRNAGNLVPAFGSATGGEEATIEYAVVVLDIRNIILCGHSQCGAMQAMLAPASHTHLPAFSRWITHAESTRAIVARKHAHLPPDERLQAATEANVLVQLNNLTTHPAVAARLSSGEINLFGWMYDIPTGIVREYDQNSGTFIELGDRPHPAAPLGKGPAAVKARRAARSTARRKGVR